jgi:hypothetical protein
MLAGSTCCVAEKTVKTSSKSKQLVLAWMMYAEDNDYIMCGPMTGITGTQTPT